MSDEDKMPDLGSLMNMAKKLQGDVVEMQQAVERMEVEASAGGGMVTAVVNGRYELVSIRIDKEVVDPNEVEMLQDLVVAAVTQATAKMRETAQAEMAKLTGGLNIPGMPTL